MRAGLLRHRVTIQRRTVTRDSFNAEIETWADWVTVWAEISTPAGGEYASHERAGAAVSHVITIRRRDGLYPTMRVRWGDRLFSIAAVLPDNLNRQISLQCGEVIDT